MTVTACPHCNAPWSPGWIHEEKKRERGGESMVEWHDIVVTRTVRCLNCFTLIEGPTSRGWREYISD
jgi:hypothetical protein